MSLFQIALLCLAPLVAINPANANPTDLSTVSRRSGENCGAHSNSRLFRREEYIDDTGENPQTSPSMNFTINIPLNNGSSVANQTLAQTDIRIPYTSLVATAFALGGGNGEAIGGGHFAGKLSGRGTRNEIYGTARYGSGYGTYETGDRGIVKYTPELILDVAGRDIPHGFPPISWGNYSGGGEYDAAKNDLARDNSFPGTITNPFDETVSGILATKNNQKWFILADRMTLDLVNSALQLPEAQGGCSIDKVVPVRMSTFGWPGPNLEGLTPYYNFIGYTGIYPWNILQWYRGSSIVLGNFTYDNFYAHNNNNNTDYWASSPLNTTGVDMDFVQCLNTTIAAVAPIINPSLIVRTRLNTGQIVGAVIGSVAGAAVLLATLWFFIRRRRQQKQSSRAHATDQSSSSSIKKGVGLGEAPADQDYELPERRAQPAAPVEDPHHT